MEEVFGGTVLAHPDPVRLDSSPSMDLIELPFVLAALGYCAASVVYFLELTGRAGEGTRPWARALLGVAAMSHAAYFLENCRHSGVCPVDRIPEATSLTGLFTAFLFLGASLVFRVDLVGAFVAPLPFATLLAERFLASTGPDTKVRAAVVPVHVTTLLVASALFGVASSLSAAYLLQEQHLKRKRNLGLLTRLPSLDVLDRTAHRFLVAGFPLMTIGILTGMLWIGHVGHDPTGLLRQVLGYLSWFFFATVLLLRSSGRWRGRRAAWGTIVGFACAVMVFVTYFVRSAGGAG